ncbi:MAG: GGDEF domain-containing protein, partial [Thermomicrobiales bacterium]
MSDSITRIIGAVMIASILLFAGYTLVDWFQGTDTLPIRSVGTLVLIACTVAWFRARGRSRWAMAGIAGLVFSITISVCTTLVTAKTNTSFEIAMAYGLVIAVLNVLVWRPIPAVLVGCAGAIGPPFVLMLSQHPHTDTLVDFTGIAVITAVLAIVFMLVQRAIVRELSGLEADLVAEASRDSLTGLPNRRSWQAHIAAWQGANAGTPYDVLFFDLDRFKDVNDRFGHDAGDRVLVTFARMLAELVPDAGAVCRFGGDEFVAFVPGGG